MAFTFVVEDGTIVAGANSFASVEAAGDVLAVEAYGKTAVWEALPLEEKQIRLAAATLWINDRYTWKGQLVAKTQALGWPRQKVKDREKNDISTLVVPSEVVRATALLAHHFLTAPEADTTLAGTPGLKRFRADTFELEMQQGYLGPQTIAPEFLRTILGGLGQFTSEPGFKPIVKV